MVFNLDLLKSYMTLAGVLSVLGGLYLAVAVAQIAKRLLGAKLPPKSHPLVLHIEIFDQCFFLLQLAILESKELAIIVIRFSIYALTDLATTVRSAIANHWSHSEPDHLDQGDHAGALFSTFLTCKPALHHLSFDNALHMVLAAHNATSNARLHACSGLLSYLSCLRALIAAQADHEKPWDAAVSTLSNTYLM
jgi:hypothetical protein